MCKKNDNPDKLNIDMEDFDKLISEDKPTLVDFFASWCGPCKMQSPIIEQVKKTIGDGANVIKVDIDSDSEKANRYKIQSVPTLFIFKNGEVKWRESGLHQADDILAKLREYMTD